MAGTLLNIKPILEIEDGEVVPLKRVRGAHKAFLEFVEAFEAGSVDRPSLRVGIAHADAPERVAALEELVRRTRPHAQIEVETTLGAVVGDARRARAAVGFFWFDDSRGASRRRSAGVGPAWSARPRVSRTARGLSFPTGSFRGCA